MGWLSALLGGETYHELDIPPIRIAPFKHLQVVDLRGVRKPDEALGVGMRVAIEMIRTIETPLQRAFVFSFETTRALLGLDVPAIQALGRSMRAHLPARTKLDSEDLVERGTGEVAIVVHPDDVARAGRVL